MHSGLTVEELGEKKFFNQISVNKEIMVKKPMGHNTLGTTITKKYTKALKKDPAIIKKFADAEEDMDEGEPEGAHIFRVTSASMLSNSGYNLSAIAKLTGHKALQSLRSYSAFKKSLEFIVSN